MPDEMGAGGADKAKKPKIAIGIAIKKKPKENGNPGNPNGNPNGNPGGNPDTGNDDEASEPEHAVKQNKEAVDYRTEAETCQHCSYMDSSDGMCEHPLVADTVAPGDSCSAFEAKEGGPEEEGEGEFGGEEGEEET
jgi:hypothetical protein